ncbi:MAG: polymer-forming cytoskeletal protein [Acidobacteria bacterium]|nr:MAG: polymer-forming cytoskeletal protein [Acidobacteriota bacterium]
MEVPMALKLGKLFRGRSANKMMDHELVGLLEPGIEFEGKMTVATGMVRINTHVKGEVDCAGLVVLAEQGEVEGLIRSRFVSIAGKVKGTIHASEKVEINATGIVLGDIHTPSLFIMPGGYFDGQCKMPVSETANISEETIEAKHKV